MITFARLGYVVDIPNAEFGDTIKYNDKFVLHTSLSGLKYPFVEVVEDITLTFTVTKIRNIQELSDLISAIGNPNIEISFPLHAKCAEPIIISAIGQFSSDTIDQVQNRFTEINFTFVGEKL